MGEIFGDRRELHHSGQVDSTVLHKVVMKLPVNECVFRPIVITDSAGR